MHNAYLLLNSQKYLIRIKLLSCQSEKDNVNKEIFKLSNHYEQL